MDNENFDSVDSVDLDTKVEYKLPFKYRVMPYVSLVLACTALTISILMLFV